MGKRISILLPSLGSGGAEKVMVTLANYFVNNGYYVDLLLIKRDGVYFNRLSEKIRIIDLNSSRALFSIPKILRYLKNNSPDVLLSVLTHTNLIAILCKLLFYKKIRIVISERTILSNASKNSNRYLFRKVSLIVHLLYPKADSIIAISNGVKDDLIKFAKIDRRKIIVIYNPITFDDRFDSCIDQVVENEIFAIKEFNDNIPVLISVGRLEKVKNYDVLIEAFNLLKQKRKIKLLILGEGIEQGNIKELITKYHLDSDVFLLGFKQNPIPYLINSDVFVLSSNWEGFGNVIVEAMSTGIKIVSTDCPSGPNEILENGKWGKLVPVNNAKLLAKAIDEIIDEKVVYDVKERAAFFSVEKIAKQYLNVLGV